VLRPQLRAIQYDGMASYPGRGFGAEVNGCTGGVFTAANSTSGYGGGKGLFKTSINNVGDHLAGEKSGGKATGLDRLQIKPSLET